MMFGTGRAAYDGMWQKICDLTSWYGGSVDVHFVYGNRQYGLEHIGIKRDPGVVACALRAVALGTEVKNVPAKKPCVSTMMA
jgi:hypothetical protein